MVTIHEDLDLKLSTHCASCGELCHQDAQVLTCKSDVRVSSIDAGEWGVPRTSRGVIHDNIGTWPAYKRQCGISFTPHRGRVLGGRRCGILRTDGEEAVVSQVREKREKHGVDALGIPACVGYVVVPRP